MKLLSCHKELWCDWRNKISAMLINGRKESCMQIHWFKDFHSSCSAYPLLFVFCTNLIIMCTTQKKRRPNYFHLWLKQSTSGEFTWTKYIVTIFLSLVWRHKWEIGWSQYFIFIVLSAKGKKWTWFIWSSIKYLV